MPDYAPLYSAAALPILQRIVHASPQKPKERAAAFALQPAQCIQAFALFKRAGESGESPVLLLIPADERFDRLQPVLEKLIKSILGYFPQERIEEVFGAPMTAVTPLAAHERKIPVLADGRLFDSETLVVSSGEPLTDLLVNADDLKSFLGSALELLDLETARKSGAAVIEPRTLKGFRDYLPEDMLPRQAMLSKISAVFERFGFAPLQTPALEYSDILLGKLGGDAEKLLFRFRDNGGRDVCLRYDLTVPLARVAAQYPDLPKPFKRYQIAPVWRAENPGRGRFREFFQCDCDIVGSASLLYDADCIALDFAVMQALGVAAQVRFNNRKVLSALGTRLQVSDARQMMAIFRTIDKLPSQGKERVGQLLKSEAHCSPDQTGTILRFVEIAGDFDAMLAQFSELVGTPGDSAVAELRTVKTYVDAQTSTSASSLALDFSIARGLDYYTGTVYETFLSDLPTFGSVMSGGRYDGLIERYSGKPTPAVGISVGIDRLYAGLTELGRISKSGTTSKACVIPLEPACVLPALKVLAQLRAAGIAAEMLLDNETKPRIDKQLSLAAKKGIPYAVILGGNEAAKGTLMLKDLSAKTQEELTLDQVTAKLR